MRSPKRWSGSYEPNMDRLKREARKTAYDARSLANNHCPRCQCRPGFYWSGSVREGRPPAGGSGPDTWCPCGLEAARTDISGTPLAADDV
jgi:hypothetical protein